MVFGGLRAHKFLEKVFQSTNASCEPGLLDDLEAKPARGAVSALVERALRLLRRRALLATSAGVFLSGEPLRLVHSGKREVGLAFTVSTSLWLKSGLSRPALVS